MNLNDPKHPWSRLVAAARTVKDDRDAAAPYGFSTRVAALAFAPNQATASLLDRFALRAVGVACLLALLSVVVNFSSLNRAATAEDEPAEDDPISLLLKVD